MSVINPLAREISAKIVYYGPGLSGKTTSLKHIHSVVNPQRRGELVTLATEGDRTIFFDFLPLQVKEVQGMGVRFSLYTVPGQVFYAATRRLVLQGADGVVFVADSRPRAAEDNAESLEDLRRNLSDADIDPAAFPIVFQYNKRDLSDVMPVERMRSDLNWIGAPEVEASALRGHGVLPALKQTSKLVIRSLWKRLPESEPPAPPRTKGRPAEGIQAELERVSAQMTAIPTDVTLTSADEAPAAATTAPQSAELPAEGVVSFASLWEGADAVAVAQVEAAIRRGAHGEALERAVAAMVELLEALPGTGEHASPMAKAALLGLDGREFLRFCRLAGLQPSSAGSRDALFALYMLVSARLKAALI